MTVGSVEAVVHHRVPEGRDTAPRPQILLVSNPRQQAKRARDGSRARLVILHRKLEIGGAERQLFEFVRGVRLQRSDDVTLVSFYEGGELFAETSTIDGLRTMSLRKRGRWDVLPFLFNTWRTIHRLRPAVLYGYQGVANELALLMGRLVGAKVVWAIRQSDVDLKRFDRLERLCFRAGAYLSRFADLIIVNSESGVRNHVALGYAPDRMIVISNGIDTSRFRPDPAAGRSLRREWGIGDDVPVVGIVGRLHPVKDLETFLRAAALVHARLPHARFVYVGDGAASYKIELKRLSRDLGIEDCMLWAGSELRMPAVMNALDVLCSSSIGEGFPNVVGEAMACGRPCVVTDVGDSARLVADCGIVVPPRSPDALSDALLSVLALEPERRRLMGTQSRKRVEEHFSVSRLVTETWSALESLA